MFEAKGSRAEGVMLKEKSNVFENSEVVSRTVPIRVSAKMDGISMLPPPSQQGMLMV